MTSADHAARHATYLPSPDQQETPDRLDALLRTVSDVRFDPDRAAYAVRDHIHTLLTNIEHALPFDPEPFTDPSNVTPHYLIHSQLRDHLDHALNAVTTNPPICPQCAQEWRDHLCTAADVLNAWSATRDIDHLLP